MPTSQPQVTISSLPHADGSATFSHNGYTVLASLNGPIEAQRRDEIPDEAFLEVNLRPASGPGGPQTTHTATLLQRTLLPLLLTSSYPRALLQLTLQILHTPSSSTSSAPPPQSATILPVLPALLHAAMLACVDAGIGMRSVAVGACVAVVDAAAGGRIQLGETGGGGGGQDLKGDEGEGAAEFILDPSKADIKRARSLHVFAYTTAGDLILAESEGVFDIDEWEHAADVTRKRCVGSGSGAEGAVEGGDVVMGGWDAREGGEALNAWLRSRVAGEIERTMRWKGGPQAGASASASL